MAMKETRQIQQRMKGWKAIRKEMERLDRDIEYIQVGEVVESVRNLPVLEGSRVHDARNDPPRMLTFTAYALEKFCESLGVSRRTMKRIKKQELASEVLDDLVRGPYGRRTLEKWMVVDKKRQSIEGIVSDQYWHIGHDAVIGAAARFTGRSMKQRIEETQSEGYLHRPRIDMRVQLKKVKGIRLEGPGGSGEDKTEIGMEVRNSLAGECAVQIGYTVKRLLCANGIAGIGAREGCYIKHIRNSEEGELKMEESLMEVMRRLPRVAEQVMMLAGTKFDPEAVIENDRTAKALEQAVRTMPGGSRLGDRLKGMLREDQKGSAVNMVRELCETERAPISTRVFRSSWRNNATLWDFANIFSEWGRTGREKYPVRRRQAEESSGRLCDVLAEELVP